MNKYVIKFSSGRAIMVEAINQLDAVREASINEHDEEYLETENFEVIYISG